MAGYKDIDPEKGKDTRFKPGQSGNPSGRSKHMRVTDALKKLMEMSKAERDAYVPENGYEELAISLLKSAFDGDGKFGVRTHAQALIYDRIEGKSEPSDKEVEAAKAGRSIIMDMPAPSIPAPKQEEKAAKPN